MSWTRAIIYDDDNSCPTIVVPTKWVCDKMVYWSNSFNAVRDLKNQITPNKAWPKYKLKRIVVQSDEYEVCDEFNFPTSSEETSSSKNKKVNNTIHSSPKLPQLPQSPSLVNSPVQHKSPISYDSPHINFQREDGSSSDESIIQKPKRLKSKYSKPQKQLFKENILRRSPRLNGKSSFTSVKYQRDIAQDFEHVAIPRYKHAAENIPLESASKQRVEVAQHEQSIVRQSSSVQLEESATSSGKDKYPLSDAVFQKKVIKQVAGIKAQLLKIKDILGNKRGSSSSQIKSFDQCEDLADLNDLEQQVKVDAKEFESLVEFLKRRGDLKFDLTVKNIMLAVSNYGVRSKFTLYGSEKKHSLTKLKLFDVIKAAVFANHQSEDDNFGKLKKRVQSFLLYAPDREGGGGRNSNKRKSPAK